LLCSRALAVNVTHSFISIEWLCGPPQMEEKPSGSGPLIKEQRVKGESGLCCIILAPYCRKLSTTNDA
jgi:hypothetical protein